MNADVTPSFVPVLSWLPGRARLARFLRLHPELEGSRSASNLLFRTMPRAGSGIATFEGGVALRCDFRSHYDRSVFTGREESTERRLLSCLLRPGDRFVDAGAHLGLHSLVAAARVGRAGRVFAFEPGREAFERLQGNVRASGFERQVEVVPRALSDETGLQVAPGGRCHDDMRGGDPDETDRAGAISITLDDALGGSAVAGMRIAAPGHEMPVLLGALRTIETSHPWLLVEFDTGHAGVSRLEDWRGHRHLAASGYEAHLPAAVVGADLSALSGSWTCELPHVNLLYWVGGPPAGLGSIRSRRVRDLVDSRVRDAARASGRRVLLPVASALVGLDRIRRAGSRRTEPPTVEALAAEPTGLVAAIAHWRPAKADRSREALLATMMRSLLSLDVPRVLACVVSNEPEAAAEAIRRDLPAPGQPVAVRIAEDPGELADGGHAEREVVVLRWRPSAIKLESPLHLTWGHVPALRRAWQTGRFSHAAYLEDDLLFTQRHLDYWRAYRPVLAPLGLLPGFVRVERLGGVEYAVDQRGFLDPAKRRCTVGVVPEGLRGDFVNLENPYQGFHLLDAGLADEFLSFSPSRSPLRSRLHSRWKCRERATIGPILDEVPDGLRSRNVVPLRADGPQVRIDPVCFIEHLSGNYVLDPGTAFSSIPAEELFVAP